MMRCSCYVVEMRDTLNVSNDPLPMHPSKAPKSEIDASWRDAQAQMLWTSHAMLKPKDGSSDASGHKTVTPEVLNRDGLHSGRTDKRDEVYRYTDKTLNA
jgi:hypothetical protein